jgi:hypothetical protein
VTLYRGKIIFETQNKVINQSIFVFHKEKVTLYRGKINVETQNKVTKEVLFMEIK